MAVKEPNCDCKEVTRQLVQLQEVSLGKTVEVSWLAARPLPASQNCPFSDPSPCPAREAGRRGAGTAFAGAAWRKKTAQTPESHATFLGTFLPQTTKEVAKMVPVEIEVVREVPIEVIREVDREVIKEVIKEV